MDPLGLSSDLIRPTYRKVAIRSTSLRQGLADFVNQITLAAPGGIGQGRHIRANGLLLELHRHDG